MKHPNAHWQLGLAGYGHFVGAYHSNCVNPIFGDDFTGIIGTVEVHAVEEMQLVHIALAAPNGHHAPHESSHKAFATYNL